MSLYINITTKEIRDLDDSLVESWIQNNNPKLLEWTLMPEKPSDNAVWDGEKWFIPVIEIPQTISARQIRLWLIQNGFQLSQIDQAINSIEDILIRETVKIEWEYAPYVERTHPWLVPLANSLGLTSEMIDQAFIEASEI
jgi:hypothetical protein